MRFPTDEHDRILRWANLDTFCDELQAPPDA
jgi:hypothetical protein